MFSTPNYVPLNGFFKWGSVSVIKSRFVSKKKNPSPISILTMFQ